MCFSKRRWEEDLVVFRLIKPKDVVVSKLKSERGHLMIDAPLDREKVRQASSLFIGKVLRPEEIEFFLKLHDLWEGILAIPPPPDPPFDVENLEPIRNPPEFQWWWKPEASDPAQFELQAPHWSPDFECQHWQHAAESAESATSRQATEFTLDADRTLVLDSDPPVQDEFPDFFYD